MDNKKFDSIIKNLDNYRTFNKGIQFTKQQDDFILKCREHDNPIAYDKIEELFGEIGWGKISGDSIRKRYLKIKKAPKG